MHNVDVLFEKIQNSILENKFESAIKICDQILKINKKDSTQMQQKQIF